MPREEKARVVAINNGRAQLELDRRASCGTCRLCFAFASKMRLEAEAVEGLKVGQTVVLSISREGSLLSVFLLFGLPLIGLIGGMLLGRALVIPGTSPEGSSIILAVAGLVAAFLLAVLFDRKFAEKTIPRPVILRIEEAGRKEPE